MEAIMLLMPLTVRAADRGNNALAMLAAIPSLVWTYIVVTVSCIVVFRLVVARPDAGFFHLLWGYCVATAPWSFMAGKDKQSGEDGSTILMFFVQSGAVAMMVASWSDPASMDFYSLAVWFVPFMALGFCAQMFLAWANTRSRYRAY